MAGNEPWCGEPQSKVPGTKGVDVCRCDAKLAGAADTAPPAAGYDALQRAERKVLRHVVTLACAIALINYIGAAPWAVRQARGPGVRGRLSEVSQLRRPLPARLQSRTCRPLPQTAATWRLRR